MMFIKNMFVAKTERKIFCAALTHFTVHSVAWQQILVRIIKS